MDVQPDARRRLAVVPARHRAGDPATRDVAADDVGPTGWPAGAPRILTRVLRSPSRRRMARRLLAAGDAERERIEHDLHDGLQQHLTALRIRLGLAADRFIERGDTDAGAVLTGFGIDVDDVIAELRSFARGIYPALLTTGGLGAALASAARYTTGPVTVRAHALRRCRPDVEAAVYFTCLAALDNVAKHAGPARVSIVLSDHDDALWFSVTDSGLGFEPGGHGNAGAGAGAGAGIANMHDRIAAIGGTLTVDSAVGQGTRVRGVVPAPWLD